MGRYGGFLTKNLGAVGVCLTFILFAGYLVFSNSEVEASGSTFEQDRRFVLTDDDRGSGGFSPAIQRISVGNGQNQGFRDQSQNRTGRNYVQQGRSGFAPPALNAQPVGQAGQINRMDRARLVASGFAPAMHHSAAPAPTQGLARTASFDQSRSIQGHDARPQDFQTVPVRAIEGMVERVDTGDAYWGSDLRSQPEHFLFGYGSLMNSASRGSTSGKVTAAIPVRLSAEFGYIREWNFRSPTSKLTALGIRKRMPGEAGSTINGVIYPVEGGSIEKFDEREEGYTRVQIPRRMIEAVGWMSLPEEGQIWVYVPDGPRGEPGEGLPYPDAFYPILQSYIDICVTGAMEYGDEFAVEFLETTYGWGGYWLNDRELPRRPWVHQKSYKAVDRLLARFPSDPRRNAMQFRRLPTEYALHFSNLGVRE